jgi:hypothetical protein
MEFLLAILLDASRDLKINDQIIYNKLDLYAYEPEKRKFYQLLINTELFASNKDAMIVCGDHNKAADINTKTNNEELYRFFNEEFGIDKMKEDLTQEIRQRGFFGGAPGGGRPQGNGAPRMGGGMPQGQGAPQMREGQNAQSSQSTQTAAQRRVSNGWVTFGEDGSFTYDLDKHLYYLAKYTTLKVAPAFSNSGLYSAGQNEDSLFGSEYDEYSPFNEYSWNNDCKENGVGKDDTGLSWKEFLSTPEGERLSLQIKMTCAMDYLLEGKSGTAPFWYVRHGMDDRDASFAVEATLFNAVMSSDKVKASDVGFAWLKPHSGDYDVAEAYSWLKGVLAK